MNSKTCQLGAFTSWMVLPETITARLRGSRDRLILRSFWFGHASPWGKETNRWWGSVQRLVCIGFSVILFWWIQNMKTPTACLVRAQKWPLWTQLRGMSDKSRKKPLCSFPSFLQRLSVVVVCFCGLRMLRMGIKLAKCELGMNSQLCTACVWDSLWAVSVQAQQDIPCLALARDLMQTPPAPWWKDFRHSVSLPQSHIQSALEIKHLELKKSLGLHVNWHDSTFWKQSFQNLP